MCVRKFFATRSGLLMRVYARMGVESFLGNDPRERRHLWNDLGLHKNVVRGMSWLLLGDFNVALNIEDSLTSSSSMTSAMCDFKNCVKHIELLHDHGNLPERVNRLRAELDEVQIANDKDPYNEVLRDEEAVYLQAFNEAKIDEERSVKRKNQHNCIEVIKNANNKEFTDSFDPTIFVEHCEAFLGTHTPYNDLNTTGLFTKQVSDESSSNMVRPVTNEEIKKVMFDIRDDKAPDPDGNTLVFFKKGWDIVGSDVCNAVRDFFGNGKLLKEINHRFLALIPKVPTPIKVNDYRLISCCNVIYKCC
ncbi:hypothetical protein Tco_1241216 [Tanacetum coccineum]